MKLYIRSESETNQISDGSTYYRCVKPGFEVNQFRYYELGIHCGSFEQAQYIKDKNMYNSYGQIYKITLNSNCVYSKPICDFEDWSSIEAVSEIIFDGFGIDDTSVDVVSDFRSGKFNKNNASEYIKEIVGSDNLVVVYKNDRELVEDDVIILDDSCINRVTLV